MITCDDLRIDLSPHSPLPSNLTPQRVLRSAGGDEGFGRDRVGGLVGL